MITRRLTEFIEIATLSASTTLGGEVVNTYLPYKSVYGSILTDQATDNNEQGNTRFDNGSTYTDRVRVYLRYLPLTLNNLIKKQYQVTWNNNLYYVTGVKNVGNRKATIIEMSSGI